jgi:hypothetical protein
MARAPCGTGEDTFWARAGSGRHDDKGGERAASDRGCPAITRGREFDLRRAIDHQNWMRPNHPRRRDDFYRMKPGAEIFTRLSCCAAHTAGTGTWPLWEYILLVGACVLTVVGLLLFGPRGSDGPRGHEDSGGGGRGGEGPELVPPGGGGLNHAPEWWPEFERQFAAYVAGRPRPGVGARER